MKNLAQLRRARLLAAPAPLDLTRIKVLQNTGNEKGWSQTWKAGPTSQSRQNVFRQLWEELEVEVEAGSTYMAVVASFWKVTKAMPRGLVWTFSFSFLYSSFSFTSLLV